MLKKQLIEVVARKAHLPKRAAEEAVNVLLDEIGRALGKGQIVKISGFGKFYTIPMKAKKVTVPLSDKIASVKARRIPKFTAGDRLKRQVAR